MKKEKARLCISLGTFIIKNRYAFTLIELLVVIAIMAVLAGITAPAIVSLMRNSNLRAGTAQVKAAIMRARTMAIANSVHCIPLVPIKVSDTPTQYALPGGAPRIWFDDAFPVMGTDASWKRGGVSGLCHTNINIVAGGVSHDFQNVPEVDRIQTVDAQNVISIWVYIARDRDSNNDGILDTYVDGIGFRVQCYVAEATEHLWSNTICWGEDIAGTLMSSELTRKGRWIQLAVSFSQLFPENVSMFDNFNKHGGALEGMEFYRHSEGSSNAKAWWDLVSIWDVYMLPENILPDPTLITYPIEFENDGRLKPTLGGHWSDRMIIVRDLGNPEPDEYDINSNKIWECEPWADDDNTFWCDDELNEFDSGDYDYGFDRVNNTSDAGEGNNGWDKEGGATSLPGGQMYIKINKITGASRVCAHPGG